MWTLLFPGQGSQSVGMGKFLYDEFKIAKETFEEASDALQINLKKLCFDGPDSDLALTENTQPALLCVSTATQKVLRSEFSLKISNTAGHSIGEYASMVAAGVLPFSSAMKAVRQRGLAMQSAVPLGQGGMLATLGLDEVQVAWLCEEAVKNSGKSPLSPANYNSPGQIVISGSLKAIEWLKENFKAENLPGSPRRAKLIPLNVSAPFHCSMMKPAEDEMRDFLNMIQFQNAAFPIIQNFTSKAEDQAEKLKENLIRQISAPVLWTQTMQNLKDSGSLNLLECGHGSVLKGLFKKFDENMKVVNFNQLDDIKNFETLVKSIS
jgi:[acyl-carrier-protein] S-malonyltransferase